MSQANKFYTIFAFDIFQVGIVQRSVKKGEKQSQGGIICLRYFLISLSLLLFIVKPVSIESPSPHGGHRL